MTLHIVQDLSVSPPHNCFAMKWRDVLKESSSPDSFKEKYLRVLCVSSVAGGKNNQALSGAWAGGQVASC